MVNTFECFVQVKGSKSNIHFQFIGGFDEKLFETSVVTVDLNPH